MKCKLCLIKDASAVKSHYISKFLRHDLFENGQSLSVRKDKTYKKINDLPKDPFIFCSECENNFSLIETISSKIIDNISKKINYQELYKSKYENNNSIIELNRSQDVFNLFIISLFWRASISKDPIFEKFKLIDEDECAMRIKLLNNLKTKKSDYKNDEISDIGFKYLIIVPQNLNAHVRGHLSAFSPSSKLHTLYLVKFYVTAFFEGQLVPLSMYNFVNEKINYCKLAVCDSSGWKKLNNAALDKFFKF